MREGDGEQAILSALLRSFILQKRQHTGGETAGLLLVRRPELLKSVYLPISTKGG